MKLPKQIKPAQPKVEQTKMLGQVKPSTLGECLASCELQTNSESKKVCRDLCYMSFSDPTAPSVPLPRVRLG